MPKSKFMLHEGRKVRVIAEAEGWSLVRCYKGAMPVVIRSKELKQLDSYDGVYINDVPLGELGAALNYIHEKSAGDTPAANGAA